jgi:hypothetical protein
MHKNVTAVYRTHAIADLVRRELSELGLSSGHIRVVPDRDEPAGADGRRGDDKYSDQLHDLHLPDEDLRTYQQCVRRGDYVVSAEVDDDHLPRAKEIMRRPEEESYHLDRRAGEFEGETLDPHSDPAGRRTNPDWPGERDPDHTDPYTRSYTRKARLDRD